MLYIYYYHFWKFSYTSDLFKAFDNIGKIRRTLNSCAALNEQPSYSVCR